jgi:hypothetical protein
LYDSRDPWGFGPGATFVCPLADCGTWHLGSSAMGRKHRDLAMGRGLTPGQPPRTGATAQKETI